MKTHTTAWTLRGIDDPGAFNGVSELRSRRLVPRRDKTLRCISVVCEDTHQGMGGNSVVREDTHHCMDFETVPDVAGGDSSEKGMRKE